MIGTSRTGTARELEVPLGVGNSLAFKVTFRCNTENQKRPLTGLSARSVSLESHFLTNI